MTDKERAFVEYYCGESRYNATEAARKAGYANPKQEGWRLRQRKEVRGAIDARLMASTLSAGDILALWTEVATADLADFYVVEGGREVGEADRLVLDLVGAYRLGKFHLIKEIRETRYGTQIVLHDAMAARDRLARVRGLQEAEVGREGEKGQLPVELREAVARIYGVGKSGQGSGGDVGALAAASAVPAAGEEKEG